MRGSNNQSSQTTSKHKNFAEESDESSDTEPSTQQLITQSTSQSASNISRFLVVQSTDPTRKVPDLSPFVIEKCILSIAGQPKSI